MRIIFLAATVVAICGCGDDSKLSRSKASSEIQKSSAFVKSQFIKIEVMNLVWDDSTYMGNSMIPVLSDMSARGLITYSRISSGAFATFRIALEEKGKPFLVQNGESGNGPDVITVKICDREVTEVTGVEQATPQVAIVEFKYKAGNRTPFGEMSPKGCLPTLRDAKAEMRRFDDGWRVIRICSSATGKEKPEFMCIL